MGGLARDIELNGKVKTGYGHEGGAGKIPRR